MKNINEYCDQISSIDEYCKQISLNEYLSAKVDATKTNQIFPHNYCLVAAFDDLYDELYDEWADALIKNQNGPNVFLMSIKDAKKYFNEKHICIYEIPLEYENIDDLEEDINNGKLDLDELNRLD